MVLVRPFMDTRDGRFLGEKSGGFAETVRTFDALRMQDPPSFFSL